MFINDMVSSVEGEGSTEFGSYSEWWVRIGRPYWLDSLTARGKCVGSNDESSQRTVLCVRRWIAVRYLSGFSGNTNIIN
jgi:hypothetical protein